MRSQWFRGNKFTINNSKLEEVCWSITPMTQRPLIRCLPGYREWKYKFKYIVKMTC